MLRLTCGRCAAEEIASAATAAWRGTVRPACGSLGWPVGREVTGTGQWSQKFQNGTLVLSANGTYSVR